VLQYTKWIDTHQRENVTMASALNSRCWARARWGQELDEALADCNAAVKLRPDTAAILDSRGLVYLRRAEFKKSIADYDAALQLNAHLAWSLYGRGIAHMRTGESARGQADIAAATALDKNIGATGAKYGVAP
jgi:tetratricopeptide (TPR) repeat protein